MGNSVLNGVRFVCAPIWSFVTAYGLWVLLSWTEPYVSHYHSISLMAGAIISVAGGFCIFLGCGLLCNDFKASVYLPIAVFVFFVFYIFVDDPVLMFGGIDPLKWSWSYKLPLVFVYLLSAGFTWKAGYKGLD